MRRKNANDYAVGEDSFLDTIANLVGILIILVVIVGANTQKTVQRLVREQVPEAKTEQLSNSVDRAIDSKIELAKQQQVLQQQSVEIAYRMKEREVVLQQIALATEDYERRLAELDTDQQSNAEGKAAVERLQRELSELDSQIGEMDAEEELETDILQHLPTPMAKTVFGEEVHLMLSQDKVSIIPWDELVARLKQDASLAVERSRSDGNIEASMPPIGGFVMNYRLVSRGGLISNGQTRSVGRVVELERFELEPTPQIHAESVGDALSGSGRLAVELARRNPKETVITVWVYPDSFDSFRTLKEQLYNLGYLTAARPLPENVRIGASPNGSKSSAQ